MAEQRAEKMVVAEKEGVRTLRIGRLAPSVHLAPRLALRVQAKT